MRLFIPVLFCVAFPAWSEAQIALPRNDATFSIGWAGSEHGLSDYDRWDASLFLGAGGGHYWTDHLKTEVEAGWHHTVDKETYSEIIIGGLRTSGHSRHRTRDVRLAVGQSYQFGRNEWMHPYVGAGADVIRRTIDLDRPAQTGYVYGNTAPSRPPTNVLIPALRTSETSTLVRPFIKAGAKMYASERLFFVTDLKLGFDRDVDHVLWKIGVGFDF
ncbi:MAG TPA: outer membrane beta-barrel protein [Vicinamibacterales bacterium]|nr:outer membrane beta-barrel protein [Vicinamibacterales bacterium]